MDEYTFLGLIWLHFIADFVLQTREVANKKSTSRSHLYTHCILYSMPFALFIGYKYAIVNAIVHGIIDSITSQFTSYYFKTENSYGFFVTIGVDQVLHMTILILSYNYLI